MPRARFSIRLATPQDIPELHRIRSSVRENQLTDPSRVRLQDYVEMLQHGRGWVADRDNVPAGFAVADPRSASVWALFVHPAHERLGAGRALHDAMVAWLFASGSSRISLTTDPGTRAERFYRAAGWQPAGEAPNGEVRYELVESRFRKSR